MSSMVQKSLRIALVAFLVLGAGALPAMASDNADGNAAAAQESTGFHLGPLVAVGAGIVTLGGGLGIGMLAKAAMEGTARQPEAGGQIRTSMIIAAALIEGFTFFALIVCIIGTGL